MNAIPENLLPDKMNWIIYKSGELYPNGNKVSTSILKMNAVFGFAKDSQHKKYDLGPCTGMDVPDYWFNFNEREYWIQIFGEDENLKIEFSSLAERDDFIHNVLKVAVGSKPAS